MQFIFIIFFLIFVVFSSQQVVFPWLQQHKQANFRINMLLWFHVKLILSVICQLVFGLNGSPSGRRREDTTLYIPLCCNCPWHIWKSFTASKIYFIMTYERKSAFIESVRLPNRERKRRLVVFFFYFQKRHPCSQDTVLCKWVSWYSVIYLQVLLSFHRFVNNI